MVHERVESDGADPTRGAYVSRMATAQEFFAIEMRIETADQPVANGTRIG